MSTQTPKSDALFLRRESVLNHEAYDLCRTLEAALRDLLEEYEDRKSQWGYEYLWEKHENPDVIDRVAQVLGPTATARTWCEKCERWTDHKSETCPDQQPTEDSRPLGKCCSCGVPFEGSLGPKQRGTCGACSW